MEKTENLKVADQRGFYWDVHIKHSPQFGFSTAYYRDRIIGQCELGRILQPMSDDDREWEMYEERFSEWRDEIIMNLKLRCETYFNSFELWNAT